MTPDAEALAAFAAWAADGLADYPSIGDASDGHVPIRGAEARRLIWRAYLGGWRHSRDGAAELLAVEGIRPAP